VDVNVKGTLMRNLIKSLRKGRAIAEPLIATHLRHYLDEQIIPTQWYPEQDYWDLVAVLAQLVPAEIEDKWDYLGRIEARIHFETVYAAMATTSIDPGRALQRIASLWSLQHDRGEMRHVKYDDNALIEVVEYPIADPFVCRAITGYVREVFVIVDLAHVVVEHHKCRGNGAPKCEWTVNWSTPRK
jgi:hypothetical protein